MSDRPKPEDDPMDFYAYYNGDTIVSLGATCQSAVANACRIVNASHAEKISRAEHERLHRERGTW